MSRAVAVSHACGQGAVRNRVIKGDRGCRRAVRIIVIAIGRNSKPADRTREAVSRRFDAPNRTGAKHGSGTVAKALADLTSSRELVNRRDKRGYRLPEWIKPQPGLFDNE